MIIDCNDCAMQHTPACEDCIVPMLLDLAVGAAELTSTEAAAVGHLADAGLVSPIRLVPRNERGRDRSAG